MDEIPFDRPTDGAKPSYVRGAPFTAPDLTLHGMLDRTVAKDARLPALYFYGEEYTFEDLQHGSAAVAAALAIHGVQKGDRVALMMPNSPHFAISLFGIVRLGAIAVQVNPMYVERETEHILRDSGAKAIIAYAPLLQRIVAADRVRQLRLMVAVGFDRKSANDAAIAAGDRAYAWEKWLREGIQRIAILAGADHVYGDDPAVFQYTGGTTGFPKGAVLTHRSLVSNAAQIYGQNSPDAVQPGDRFLAVIPLSHVYGLTTALLFPVYVGAASILLPRFDIEEVLETIKKYRPTVFPGVPTMYVAIASHPQAKDYGLELIRMCISGSAPLPLEVIRKFMSVAPLATMLEGYGLTEASPVTHNNAYSGERRVGSVGLPLPGTEAAIIDSEHGRSIVPVGTVGELVVRGPQLMKEYWNMPEETADALRNGWLFTGDMAKMDEDGFTYIVDRKKDMIIAGGFNVYPREVEEVLYAHPAVQEAAVVGVADEYRGETVLAYIVPKPGQVASPAEIEAFCRERLAAYKIPRRYVFRESLPKSAVGKVLRRELREDASRSSQS